MIQKLVIYELPVEVEYLPSETGSCQEDLLHVWIERTANGEILRLDIMDSLSDETCSLLLEQVEELAFEEGDLVLEEGVLVPVEEEPYGDW